ncbi:DUF4358 domain-containing protein [Fenollaria massiliensis]|uniref:DUF4358 domain-containing protein n=1 Tax=Fenollaria massiliensis TaxID=938288 RepID=A0A9E7IX52_9FIRM|nr:DUF4358 domain-containing protein [Fenollaria massiliensis]UQK59470.1 DUF4358 domain-containing protein [Fenollaria massiliensis]
MKKILIILSVALMIFMVGCSSKDVSLNDIKDKLKDTIDFSTFSKEEEDSYLKDTFDFDTEKIDSYEMYGPQTNLNTNAVLLLRLKNASDASEFKEKIDAYKENLIKIYKDYAPDQAKLVEDSVYEEHGKTIVLVISEKSEDVKKALAELYK